MEDYKSSFDFGRYNTKIKRYRDGSCSVVYSDANIFLPSDQVCIDDDEFEKWGAVISGRIKSKIKKDEHEHEIEFLRDKVANSTNDFFDYQKILDSYLKFDEDKKERARNDSMKRAIDKVYDIAFQNDWSYFFTGTLNADNNFDRCEPKEIIKPLNQWLNNQVKRRGLQYLMIPEVHPEKGEGIHFHGLINDSLDLSDSGRVLFRDGKAWRRDDVKRLGDDPSNYRVIYNVDNWKYGFSTAIQLQGSPASVACYITKYITKDVKKLFGRFYYSSRNIEKNPEMIFLHTDKAAYDGCNSAEVRKFGVGLKYQSDFLFKDTDTERNPTDDLLKYLSERGYIK